jgi:hypothetical protein
MKWIGLPRRVMVGAGLAPALDFLPLAFLPWLFPRFASASHSPALSTRLSQKRPLDPLAL